MKAGIAQSGRTILAAITAALMVMSVMFVFADTADANHDLHDDTVANDGPAGTNETPYWVTYLDTERGITGATCEKINENDNEAWVMPAEPDGEDWVLLVVKQGGTNFVFYDPIAGHTYPSVGENAPGYSHILVCSVAEPDTFDLEVEKVWAGEEINLEGITVTFDFDPSNSDLEDGDVVTITEVVEGDLPEECTYTSDLDEVSPYTVDESDAVEGIISLTVTNTVECESTPPTTTPPTTTPPTTTPPTTTPPTTTPPTTAPPEVGEIVVEKVVTGDASQTFEFTFDTTGFTLGDNTLAHGESSSSGDVAVGDGYSVSESLPAGWTQVSAVCDDGSPITNIDVDAGETVTCTFTNTIENLVGASIVVTVGGACEVDGDEGQGVIDVEISVDGGADVVISDSDGDVIETLTSSGTVTVPEGATYTWEATPNEGFEFPEGSDTSGSITIETCSDDPETLPFTGLDTGMMSLFGTALLGGGLLLVTAMRRQEEA